MKKKIVLFALLSFTLIYLSSCMVISDNKGYRHTQRQKDRAHWWEYHYQADHEKRLVADK